MIAGNPFYFGRMVAGNAFTNREKETQRLVSNFRNGINTILISPRRWGKSSLVRKVGETLTHKDIRIVYIDAFSLRNEHDFYTAFANAVLAATSSHWEERLKSLKEFIRQITPIIKIGIDPEHEFSVSFDWEELRQHPNEILDLPEKIAKGFSVVVCVDEFQNITVFNDSLAFQKLLRSVWQKHEKTCYCLYGSKFHMMQELFERQSMPFYRFGDLIHLGKITAKDWQCFIKERFENTVPEAGSPTFSINDDEIEIGMGIHGEPGIEVHKMMTADEIATAIMGKILEDMPLSKGDEVSVMVNGLGATPLEELLIVFRKVHMILKDSGVSICMPHIGEFATSMEMAGLSVTILKLDTQLKELLRAPASTPFYTNANK